MARISGVDLPNAKRVEIGLTYIYGIGRARSNEILEKTGINPDTRVKDLTEEDVAKLLHISQNTYSQYEIGTTRYPLDAVVTLAEFYGVSVDYLVELTDDPKPYPRKRK